MTRTGTDGERRVNNSWVPKCAPLESVKNLARVVTLTTAPSLEHAYQVHTLNPLESIVNPEISRKKKLAQVFDPFLRATRALPYEETAQRRAT